MFLRSINRLLVRTQSLPWLDSNTFPLFVASSNLREQVARTGIVNSFFQQLSVCESKLAQLTTDLKDKSLADLRDLICEEQTELEHTINTTSDNIRQLVLSRMEEEGLFEEDQLDARIEVRAGVGGDEAVKWAEEIFNMYLDVSGKMGWLINIKNQMDNSEVMKAEILKGSAIHSPYGLLQFESGVHRVQRIPFNSDRMQTSAGAVYVVPIIEVPKVTIRDSDLKVHISKKSSGAGGQSVNAAYQQVRMTHIPSGYTVVVNESHAQQENRETAYKLIIEKVQLIAEEKALAAMAFKRKGQVGTADRSEKVRSYNFQRHEVNDHRITGVVRENISDFMTNCDSLVSIWKRLRKERENDMINQFIYEISRKIPQ